jgi:hypothetical protein
MSIRSPANQSIAQPTKYQLIFDRLPEVNFFCQSVVLPGANITPTYFATPFIDQNLPGDKLKYNDFSVSFIIDEDFKSWFSIYEWMVGLTFPESFEQYRNLDQLAKINYGNISATKKLAKPAYSDAILTLTTNKNNPNIRVKFYDVFPVSLSSVNFSYAESAEQVLTGEVSLSFSYFTFDRV